MKLIDTEFPILAFVDIETTGGNFDRDRLKSASRHWLTGKKVLGSA